MARAALRSKTAASLVPAAAIALAAAFYALALADAYALRLITLSGIYALAVIGYQIVFGHAGAISLAQGAFFGFGGYASGLLAYHFGAPFIVSFPVAILAAAIVAGIVALPVLKLESHYLALATLALAELALLAALSFETITGGANGLAGIPPLSIAGAALGRGLFLAAFVWLCVGIGAWLAFRWLSRGTGSALATLRADPLAAACVGLDVGLLRVKALMASAAFGAAAGALNVHAIGVLSPDLLGFPIMVTILAMTVIGGSLRLGGGIAAAILLIHLPEWFRFLERHYLIAYGVAMLATLLLAPGGLAASSGRIFGLVQGIFGLARRPPARPAAPAGTADPLPRRHTAHPRVLALAGVSKRFGGITALADISLSVRSAEIVGLIGPNGSGKSTLLNAVSGLIRPDAGHISIAGRDIAGLAPHRIARIGVGRGFQTPALAGDLTALEAVAVACAATGARSSEAEAAAMALLAEMGVEAEAFSPCADLSAGMTRRVEIARALGRSPGLLLLDEPAAGLAENECLDLATRLRRLAERGIAIVIVEHNLPFLLDLADRILCLDGGRVIAMGSPEAIRTDPGVIGAYLGGIGGAA